MSRAYYIAQHSTIWVSPVIAKVNLGTCNFKLTQDMKISDPVVAFMLLAWCKLPERDTHFVTSASEKCHIIIGSLL